MFKEQLEKIVLKFMDMFQISFIEYFKSLCQKKGGTEHIEFEDIFEIYSEYIEILPNSKPDQLHYGTRFTYVLEDFIFKQLYNLSLKNSDFNEFYEILIKEEYVKTDLSHFMGPTRSEFGFLIREIVNIVYNIDNEDIHGIDLGNFSFELKRTNLIKLQAILENFYSENINITIYYFIFGAKFPEKDFIFDKHLNIEFKYANSKRIENLSKILTFTHNEYALLLDDLSWIVNLRGWLEKKITIPKTEFSNLMKNKHLSLNLKLPNPIYIESAFHLLGYYNVRVRFSSFQTTLGNEQYTLHPYHNGIRFSYSYFAGRQNIFFNDVEWFSRFHSRNFDLNESNLFFLREFSSYINSLEGDALNVRIIKRFERMLTAVDKYDVILESMIILDGIISKDRKDLSYQIRIKTPRLIFEDLALRKELKTKIKLLYDIRSSLVHSLGTDLKKSINKLKNSQFAADLSKELVRSVILRLIKVKSNKIDFVSRDELGEILEDCLMGYDLKIPRNHYFLQYGQPKVMELLRKS